MVLTPPMDALAPPIPPGPVTAPEPVRIDYVPRDGLGKLTLVNALLTIVTLTIYRFWAKTNVRKHIWSCVHVNGEPLEYTGRGMELFKGFLVVLGVFILPVVVISTVLQLTFGPEHPALVIFQLVIFLLISVFWGMALYRARRYQLSRTLWRGIRGTMTGSPWMFSLIYFGALILRSLTLGWSTPAMNLNIQERMIGEMRFGSMPFRFKGRAGPLYGQYAICWFLSLAAIIGLIVIGVMLAMSAGDAIWQFFAELSLGSLRNALILFGLVFAAILLFSLAQGLLWSFYIAKELSVFAGYTTFGDGRFRFDATPGSLVALAIGNFLITILTLGFGLPFVQQRLVRYLCDRVTVDGMVNLDAIAQSRQPVDRAGEGLADAFDVGGI
jgi:uncharacterized membrane protein YjgN (DUF898 family)